jgi:SPW repeat
MRFIPTRVHGMVDYAMGLVLIVAPWVLGFAPWGAQTWVPGILGIATIGYSFFTDYELGLVRAIPMRRHLALDAGSGAFLAASPWLFGFADLVYVPHLILGLVEIGAALTTHTTPGDRRPVEMREAHAEQRRL